MKLSVLQKDLAKSLALAARFVSARVQLPILSNIVLSAEKTKLYILATNLETSIATSIGAKVDKDGQIGVPARVVTELVSNLPADQVFLEVDKEALKISSSSFSGSVLGMNASDFPSIPRVLGKGAIDLPKDEFLSALSKVIFSASVDETRPILTGVLFIFEADELALVASDGFRLSQKKLKLGKKVGSGKVVIPKSFLNELLRVSQETERLQMEIKKEDNQALFVIGDSVLTTRILEGEFPNFEKIIPKTTTIKVSLDKEDLLKSIKLASVYARESANIVKLMVLKEGIEVFSESSKSGSEKTKVEARIEGGELEISYNYRFIEEFLGVAEGEEVEIGFTDSTSPGIFKDKDLGYLHLIMPVRIQS